jgi:hypothetical protein
MWLNTIKRHRRWAAALVLATAGVTASPFPAAAHSFYSKRCCNDKDCAPVDAIEFLPGGAIKTTTRHGTVVFPAGHKMLPSKDGRFHACMRNYAEWGDDRLRGVCLYAPAGM